MEGKHPSNALTHFRVRNDDVGVTGKYLARVKIAKGDGHNHPSGGSEDWFDVTPFGHLEEWKRWGNNTGETYHVNVKIVHKVGDKKETLYECDKEVPGDNGAKHLIERIYLFVILGGKVTERLA